MSGPNLNPLDIGDCFFELKGSIDAHPDAVYRRQRVTVSWTGSEPGVGCPPLTWWVASPDWREVQREGSLEVETMGDVWFSMGVTAHDGKWSRGLASVWIDMIVPEKPEKP
jgi:hypothetical protein